MSRTAVGVVVLLLGVALLVAARVERHVVPRWTTRLATGVATLGASTLAMAREGVGWNVASIALSVVSIALLLSVIWQNLRR